MNEDQSPAATRADGVLTQLITAGAVSLPLGILFYMGRIITQESYRYFHVDTHDLQFGFEEYALRGLGLLTANVIVTLAGVVLVMVAVRHLAPLGLKMAARRSERAVELLRRWRPVLVVWLGCALCASGVVLGATAGLTGVSTVSIALLLGLGLLVATWPGRRAGAGRGCFAAALGVALLCGFWAAGLHAERLGREQAAAWAHDLALRPQVVILSTERLALATPAVKEEAFAEEDGRFRFRYSGFRLLAARGERFYLLPDGWNPRLDPTFVFRDSEDLRIELYTSGR